MLRPGLLWPFANFSVTLASILFHADAIRTLGATLNCDSSVFGRSPQRPTNVNQIRLADIDVVAAMGDSLTVCKFSYSVKSQAGAGARATSMEDWAEERGVTFDIGGQLDLDEHISIPGILKIFNPNLKGFATGPGEATDVEVKKR